MSCFLTPLWGYLLVCLFPGLTNALKILYWPRPETEVSGYSMQSPPTRTDGQSPEGNFVCA